MCSCLLPVPGINVHNCIIGICSKLIPLYKKKYSHTFKISSFYLFAYLGYLSNIGKSRNSMFSLMKSSLIIFGQYRVLSEFEILYTRSDTRYCKKGPIPHNTLYQHWTIPTNLTLQPLPYMDCKTTFQYEGLTHHNREALI